MKLSNGLVLAVFPLILAACASEPNAGPWPIDRRPESGERGIWVSLEPDRQRIRQQPNGDVCVHWTGVIMVTSASASAVESAPPRVGLLLETLHVRPHHTEVLGMSLLQLDYGALGTYWLPRGFSGAIWLSESGVPRYVQVYPKPELPFLRLTAPRDAPVLGHAWIIAKAEDGCTMPDRKQLYREYEWWRYPDLMPGAGPPYGAYPREAGTRTSPGFPLPDRAEEDDDALRDFLRKPEHR